MPHTFLAEKALDEECNAAEDFYLDDDGRPIFDGHHVQRSKLIIVTIKCEVSKMLPRIYGDKVTQEFGVTGDLAALKEAASDRDAGLLPPIEVEYDEVLPDDRHGAEMERDLLLSNTELEQAPKDENCRRPSQEARNAPSTPSNHRRNRKRRHASATD